MNFSKVESTDDKVDNMLREVTGSLAKIGLSVSELFEMERLQTL